MIKQNIKFTKITFSYNSKGNYCNNTVKFAIKLYNEWYLYFIQKYKILSSINSKNIIGYKTNIE